MPDQISMNDTFLGFKGTSDNGRQGYSLSVTMGGSGATSSQIQGSSAAGAASSGNPVKVGAVYNTTLPTYTTGQQTELQAGARGSLNVTLMQVDGTTPVASVTNNADGVAVSANANKLAVVSYAVVYNGTTFDRQRKANAFNRVVSSAASGNPAVGKASAGDVMQFWGQNGAAITYLQIYNKATAPVIGTDTPLLTFPIPANATFSQTIPNGGAYFGTGIAYAFTTDAAGATGAAAAAVTAFNLLVA